jgi:hypothetical protein
MTGTGLRLVVQKKLLGDGTDNRVKFGNIHHDPCVRPSLSLSLFYRSCVHSGAYTDMLE